MATENYYKILDLQNFVTDQSVIRDAYLKKIKLYHPDTTKLSKEIAEKESKKINAAYDILSNPQKKMEYDNQLRTSLTTSNSSRTAYGNHTNFSYSNNYQSNNQYYRTNRKIKTPFHYWLIMFIIYRLLSTITPSSSSSNNYNNIPTTISPSPPQSMKIEHQVIEVESGEILRYPRDEMVAPLEINTSTGYNYYISLEDLSNDGNNNMSFYVKGGDCVEKDIPLGRYNIYYAVGKEWYGVFVKFGDATSYYKCEGTFNFTNDGTYYNGYELTLYKVPYGNMETEIVTAVDFPN